MDAVSTLLMLQSGKVVLHLNFHQQLLSLLASISGTTTVLILIILA